LLRHCFLREALAFAVLICPFSYSQTAPVAAIAASASNLAGVVTDSSGAIVPGAKVLLLDKSGVTILTGTTDAAGQFLLNPTGQGSFTLSVSLDGFQTATQAILIPQPASTPLQIKLAIASVATQIIVNGGSDVDLTNSENNTDSTVMTSADLKQLPLFDNDYVSAMSSFLDQGAAGSDGSGLMVDGMDANRVTVSTSAVQEVRINQDPYSAKYYRPGRGQMEIVTKSTADAYHGEFNFFFRDSALNAQNAFAPTKPYEQRRVYEGSATGPVLRSKTTSFLFSFNRAEEDLNSVVNATVPATPENPEGVYQANVPAPVRDTEFSARIARQFGSANSAYAQYSYQDTNSENQGVGNQTLPEAGTNNHYHEDDVTLHDDTVVSPAILSQFSLLLESDSYHQTDTNEAAKVRVQGNFVGGSAQANQVATEYNIRLGETVYWTRGRNQFIFGVNMPHMSRRAFDDYTNSSGTYTYASLDDYQANNVSSFSGQTGQTHFVYHQEEVGGFIQDQIKVTPRFSLTPGLRYDWQNLLSANLHNFAPRLSFAIVLDPASKTVLRGGGGLYYDRPGNGPLLDLARYRTALRRQVQITSTQAPLCVPITDCVDLSELPSNFVELAPGIQTPYQVHYGASLERALGEKATITLSGYASRGIALFRSVDVNAPTPESGYVDRPDASIARLRQIQAAGTQIGNAADIAYRGRYNKWFSGFGHYTWSHWENNTGGIGWFPQNQQDPDDEWANADWDQRQRLGFYAMFHPESVFNLSVGLFANSGRPYTITTGTDLYGDNLFNTRPDGVDRNSGLGPDYVGLDLRWGHDFKIEKSEHDNSPTVGASVAAFNVLNHVNGSYVDSVEGSANFGEIIAAAPARRIQLGMRLTF
jgi:Carboxypeptidase regulatory-like domain/TonB dependent receptor